MTYLKNSTFLRLLFIACLVHPFLGCKFSSEMTIRKEENSQTETRAPAPPQPSESRYRAEETSSTFRESVIFDEEIPMVDEERTVRQRIGPPKENSPQAPPGGGNGPRVETTVASGEVPRRERMARIGQMRPHHFGDAVENFHIKPTLDAHAKLKVSFELIDYQNQKIRVEKMVMPLRAGLRETNRALETKWHDIKHTRFKVLFHCLDTKCVKIRGWLRQVGLNPSASEAAPSENDLSLFQEILKGRAATVELPQNPSDRLKDLKGALEGYSLRGEIHVQINEIGRNTSKAWIEFGSDFCLNALISFPSFRDTRASCSNKKWPTWLTSIQFQRSGDVHPRDWTLLGYGAHERDAFKLHLFANRLAFVREEADAPASLPAEYQVRLDQWHLDFARAEADLTLVQRKRRRLETRTAALEKTLAAIKNLDPAPMGPVERNEWQQNVNSANRELTEARRQKAQAEADGARLTQVIARLRERLESVQKEAGRALETRQLAERAIDRALGALESKQIEVNRLGIELSNLKDRLANAGTEVGDANRTRAQLRADRERLQKEINRAREAQRQSLKIVKAFELRLEAAAAERVRLAKELEARNAQLKTARDAPVTDQQQARVRRLSQEVQASRARLARKDEALSTARRGFGAELSARESEIAQLETEIETHKAELAERDQALRRLEANPAQTEALESEIQRLHRELAKRTAEAEEAQRALQQQAELARASEAEDGPGNLPPGEEGDRAEAGPCFDRTPPNSESVHLPFGAIYITNRFGDPSGGKRHRGLDFVPANAQGQTLSNQADLAVQSPVTACVEEAENSNGDFGNYVLLSFSIDSQGWGTLGYDMNYKWIPARKVMTILIGHLAESEIAYVKPGDIIEAGTILGYMGNTGTVRCAVPAPGCGRHVHLELSNDRYYYRGNERRTATWNGDDKSDPMGLFYHFVLDLPSRITEGADETRKLMRDYIIELRQRGENYGKQLQ